MVLGIVGPISDVVAVASLYSSSDLYSFAVLNSRLVSYPPAALSSLAFSAKKDKLKKATDFYFEDRTNFKFFKSHSKVDKAKGFDVDTMSSAMGIFSKGDKAAENLKQQEKGGKISSRSFIARDDARTGKSFKKKISKVNRLSVIEFVNNKNATQSSIKSKRAAAINIAAKEGKDLLMGKTLYRVKKSSRKRKGKRKMRATIKPIYSFKKGRSVQVRRRPFIQRAGQLAQKGTLDFFEKEFEFEINKLIKKGKL